MKILFLGGGTAGHIFPLLSVKNAFLEQFPETETIFVCAKNGNDQEILKKNNVSFVEMPVAKLRRYFSWENFSDFFTFFTNFFLAAKILKQEKPDAIFSKGGFVSLPVGIAAFFLNIPLFLHETDSTMGLSNRILSRFSTKIFTGFPSQNKKHVFVGNPIRKEFFEKKFFPSKTEDDTLKILVIGGSQGSTALNGWARTFFLSKTWEKILEKQKKKMEMMMLAGKGKVQIPNQENEFMIWKEVEFLHENFVATVQKSDLIISRSGGSVAEFAAAEKPILLVPLPSSANNHQWKNAKFFEKQNAALCLEEKNFVNMKENIVMIENFCFNTDLQKQLSKNLAAFAMRNSAEIIVKEISNHVIKNIL